MTTPARPKPRKLLWTNLALAGSIIAFLLTILFAPGISMLGSAVVFSFMLLQFYRMVLLLFTMGGEAAWLRMRKWNKHV